jgi:hypothetical protein
LQPPLNSKSSSNSKYAGFEPKGSTNLNITSMAIARRGEALDVMNNPAKLNFSVSLTKTSIQLLL